MARTICDIGRKEYVIVDTFVTGYHVYKNQWLPEYGQLLNVESESSNRHDGYAVAVKKENKVVGHLPKDSRHVIFFFLQADSSGKCIAIMTDQPVNLGDKLGQKIPCRLRLSGDKLLTRIVP